MMDKAKRIVKAIVDDFTDCRGLRQEWEQIDAEIQREMFRAKRDNLERLVGAPDWRMTWI